MEDMMEEVEEMNEEKSSLWPWLIAGAAVGAAYVYFTQSESGKRITEDAKEYFRTGTTRDDRLQMKVFSELSRLLGAGKEIQVRAEKGSITLSGPILSEALEEVLVCARHIPGVKSVINNLEVRQQH